MTAFASGNTPEVGRYTTLMDVTEYDSVSISPGIDFN
ncbi:UNVERIFIED_ORG: hypothetical protein ABIB19_002804 [Arthrobacter sp. UYEF10]